MYGFDLRKPFQRHPNRCIAAGSIVAFGTYALGCIEHVPGVAVPCLGVGGAGIISLVQKFSDYLDTKEALLEEAAQIIQDAGNEY